MKVDETTKKKLDVEGLIGPYDLSTLKQVDALNLTIDTEASQENIHNYNSLVEKILFDEAVVKYIKAYFKLHYRLWRTNVFSKSKLIEGEIAWHHDKHFQNEDMDIDFCELGEHVSILVSLNDVHEGNGPLEYISGTHREIDGFKRDKRPFHLKKLDEHFIDIPKKLMGNKKTMLMKKGQFALFHSALLHKTSGYSSGDLRRNLIGRFAAENVSIPSSLDCDKTKIIELK